uniref:Uncharacterized protein n=1 Tax=Cacopsylla melanoneura TaxID=428564 RepID=A0A8D8XDA2_9HEMI
MLFSLQKIKEDPISGLPGACNFFFHHRNLKLISRRLSFTFYFKKIKSCHTSSQKLGTPFLCTAIFARTVQLVNLYLYIFIIMYIVYSNMYIDYTGFSLSSCSIGF